MSDFVPMPAAIAGAICKVMAAVPRLEKGEKNPHGKYNFASIDDFLEAVRPLCAENGLIILQDEETFTAVDGWLNMRFAFTLAHESGETWAYQPKRSIMVSAKMGAQAFGAGQSYALKQFMRSLFQIATGEKGQDADEHPAADLPQNAAPQFEAWEKFDLTKTKAETLWRDCARQIKSAKTEAEIDGILEETDYKNLVEAIQQCSDTWPPRESAIDKKRKELQTGYDERGVDTALKDDEIPF